MLIEPLGITLRVSKRLVRVGFRLIMKVLRFLPGIEEAKRYPASSESNMSSTIRITLTEKFLLEVLSA